MAQGRADVGSGGLMATVDVVTETNGDGQRTATRRIRRHRGLPGGRPVIGALLVAAAAFGVFAAHLQATAPPSTAYLVAVTEVVPGTRFDEAAALEAAFEAVPLALSPEMAERAVRVEDASGVLGRRVLLPLAPGELLTRSALLADGGVTDAETVAFPVARSAALDGAIRVGERIDVLATYRATEDYTAYVLRGVPVLAIGGEGSAGVGGSGRDELVLTVAVGDARDVQALVHAVQTAEVVVARSTAAPDAIPPAPDAYISAPTAPGPLADPSGREFDHPTDD